jgi:hypothetical protein
MNLIKINNNVLHLVVEDFYGLVDFISSYRPSSLEGIKIEELAIEDFNDYEAQVIRYKKEGYMEFGKQRRDAEINAPDFFILIEVQRNVTLIKGLLYDIVEYMEKEIEEAVSDDDRDYLMSKWNFSLAIYRGLIMFARRITEFPEGVSGLEMMLSNKFFIVKHKMLKLEDPEDLLLHPDGSI